MSGLSSLSAAALSHPYLYGPHFTLLLPFSCRGMWLLALQAATHDREEALEVESIEVSQGVLGYGHGSDRSARGSGGLLGLIADEEWLAEGDTLGEGGRGRGRGARQEWQRLGEEGGGGDA